MSSNVLVKSLMGVTVLIVCLFGLMKVRSNEVEIVERPIEPMDKKTLAAIGIEGDTPNDTLKTVVASMRAQTEKLTTLESDNEALRAENKRLQSMEKGIESRLASTVTVQAKAIEDQSRASIENARNELQMLISQTTAAPTIQPTPPPVKQTYPGATIDSDGTVWVPPLGGSGQSSGLLSKLTNLPDNVGLPSQKAEKLEDVPAYTIAKNSTLIGAKSFTALIGRVPVGENVVDPYSFKVIIGNDNLISNGHRVPELSHAVMSGRAIGDWTLGCVSGDVYSVTFVFKDGRIRTLPKPADISNGGGVTPDLKIGELSDAQGNPCVPGRKISNAVKHLAQATLATAAGAAAGAAAASETTTVVTGDSNLSAVTGSKSDYIKNQTIAGAVGETAQWLRDRQALEFDAVYVEPGAAVAIHITEQLNIDYEPDGRLTRYNNFSTGNKVRSLD